MNMLLHLALMGILSIPHIIAQDVNTNSGLTEEEIAIFGNHGVIAGAHTADQWLLHHSGIPTHDHEPGPYTGNPNTVGVQNHTYTIPKVPTWEETPGCLPQGMCLLCFIHPS